MKSFLKITAMTLLLALLAVAVMPFAMEALYPLKYREYIEKYSALYDLDEYFVMGVISAESRFSEEAVSHKSAKGLMQLQDETARWCAEKFGIEGEIYSPAVNIQIGCAYLRYLLDLFDENEVNALAAYNAGQGKVAEWLADPNCTSDGKTLDAIPYGETRHYVKRVKKREYIYRKIYD